MREGEPNFEEEKNPEQIVKNALSAVENKDASDTVLGSYWSKQAKEFFSVSENWKDLKTTAAVAGISIGALLFICGKVALGVLKFAKKAIEKKGNVGFKEGWEIGGEIFSFDGKKEKK
ncbi:MAG: hypothetical protein AAB352_00490 [Patescibacteria group bacterium]